MKEEDAHDHEAKDRLVQMAGYNIKGLAEEDELQQLRRKKMEGKGIKAGVRPAEQVIDCEQRLVKSVEKAFSFSDRLVAEMRGVVTTVRMQAI